MTTEVVQLLVAFMGSAALIVVAIIQARTKQREPVIAELAQRYPRRIDDDHDCEWCRAQLAATEEALEACRVQYRELRQAYLGNEAVKPVRRPRGRR